MVTPVFGAAPSGRRPARSFPCGQVLLPFLGRPIVPSEFRQRYAHGLVQGPAFPVIISAGIGMSLIPIRLGVPPEVVEVELVVG